MAALTLVCVACDQATKAIAAAYLAGRGATRLLGGLVVLVFAENKGAFLSLGSGLPPFLRTVLLVALPLVALVFLGWALVSRGLSGAAADGAEGSGEARPLSGRAGRIAAVLVLSGGAGNLIDRLAYGEVRDFLLFRLGNLSTGIMNLADLYILAALVLVIVAIVRSRGDSNPSGVS
jgi:Lipoprotein signal peptidase